MGMCTIDQKWVNTKGRKSIPMSKTVPFTGVNGRPLGVRVHADLRHFANNMSLMHRLRGTNTQHIGHMGQKISN